MAISYARTRLHHIPQQELEKNFSDYIGLGMRKTGLDRETYLGKMRKMYDGYRFHQNAPKVYNPVSVGLFFSKGGAEFNNYWFETGGNTRLVMNVVKEVDFNITTDLDSPVSADSLSDFDIAALEDPSGGVSFSKEKRNIVDWKEKTISGKT